jgi:signal transduction histidine kinase/chemotaxis methyl-accepting protein methylase
MAGSTAASLEDRGRASAQAVVAFIALADDAQPLGRLLRSLPTGHGLAIVVVAEAHGATAAALADRLAGGGFPVEPMEADDHLLRPDRVVVVTADRPVEVAAGRLRATPVRRTPRERMGRFLSTLAADRHESAICVVLSPSSDPRLQQLRDVRAQGGLVIAVGSPRATGHAGAPDDRVDIRLAVERIPQALLRHAAACGSSWRDDPVDEPVRHTVLELLRHGTGQEFRRFDHAVLSRSVRRRMSLTGATRPQDYQHLLGHDAAEAVALMQDLLLRPVGFFRDPESWLALEENAIAPMLRRDPDAEWRVWVPACATGEEAYTVAIAMLEQMRAHGHRGRLTVFATDIDAPALARARAGRYDGQIEAAMPAQRLGRHFRPDGEQFVVRGELREAMVFATHDLLEDAAFSSLDLVVCRGFLPLLDAEGQSLVLAKLHFALDPERFLMLGKDEAPHGLAGTFEPVARLFGLHRRTVLPGPARPRGRALADRPRRGVVGDTPAAAEAAPEQAQQLLEEALQRTRHELRQALETVESTNEELVAVNRVLADRIMDLETVNDDLTNLLASADTPTLFLDPALRVRRYTPAATQLFRLRTTDLGRRIDDIASRCPMDTLLADARQVLDAEAPVERELTLGDEHFLQRVLPYRDRDDRVDGVVVMMTDITDLTSTRQQLQASQLLAMRIDQTREEERARIAREIHDELGATLTGIKMHLQAARLQSDARAVELPHQLDAVPELVDAATHAVQRIIGDLRPSVLDHLGVWTAIAWYAERVLPAAGIAWRCDVAPEVEALDLAPDRATAIFRIAQEALTNVVRHAGARHVDIRAHRDDDALVMEVHDDGRGIEPVPPDAWRSSGLLGMRERARHQGGTVTVGLCKESGTCVVLRMPAS